MTAGLRGWIQALFAVSMLATARPHDRLPRALRTPLAQQGQTSVVVSTLRESAYLLAVRDSVGLTNLVASIGPEGALLVDHLGDWRTRLPDTVQARIIRDAMDGVRRTPLRFIVNTHSHGDHTGGNEIYGRTATVIAHAGTRAALLEPDGFGGMTGRLMGRAGLPTLTFDDSLTVHLNGETVRLVHFGPAHTRGDLVAFLEKADVVHMGDLFHGLDAPPTGDIVGLARTFRAVTQRIGDSTIVITGHGRVESKASLATLAAFLEVGIDTVRARSQRGMSLPDIQRLGVPGADAERLRPAVRDRLLAQIHRGLQLSRSR